MNRLVSKMLAHAFPALVFAVVLDWLTYWPASAVAFSAILLGNILIRELEIVIRFAPLRRALADSIKTEEEK